MGRYDFQRKLEECERLLDEKKYEQAVGIVDSLNLRPVDDPVLLQRIADAYEKCARYNDACLILKQAAVSAPRSRDIRFNLCLVTIEAGNTEEAEVYYKEFCDIAPGDSAHYILLFWLACAEGAGLDVQIKILRAFMDEDPDDKWLLQLAKLHLQAGQKEEAIEVLGEIETWFNSGEFVQQAHQLKNRLLGIPEEKPEQQERVGTKVKPKENPVPDVKSGVRKDVEQTDSENNESQIRGTGRAATGFIQKTKVQHPDPAGYTPVRAEEKRVPDPAGYTPVRAEGKRMPQPEDYAQAKPGDYEMTAAAAELRQSAEAKTAAARLHQPNPENDLDFLRKKDLEDYSRITPFRYDVSIDFSKKQEVLASAVSDSRQNRDIVPGSFPDMAVNPPYSGTVRHFAVFGDSQEDIVNCCKKHFRQYMAMHPDGPQRFICMDGEKIGNVSILGSLEKLLGCNVLVENAGSLSEEQILDFAQILEKDDQSLIVCFADTKVHLSELFIEHPILAGDITAVYSAK